MRNNRNFGLYKLFAFVFFLFISILLISIFIKNIIISLVIGALILAFFFVSKKIWLPEGYGNFTIRFISLSLGAGLIMSFGIWQSLVEKINLSLIESIFPAWIYKGKLSDISPEFALGCFLLIVWIVNYNNKDRTAMGKYRRSKDEDIPIPSYQQRLLSVCESLTEDLKTIDRETKWSMRYFTPLEAEVEVHTRKGKEKRITDLLSAIKKSNDRLFLVLGDPGSGKSVALRKLCRDLAGEVKKTGKLPVYINLKEWKSSAKWDESNPPTIDQLKDFVIQNLKSNNIVSSKFFDAYFDKMYETGRLYFIFDSFDEIPAVLDERGDCRLRLDKYSLTINQVKSYAIKIAEIIFRYYGLEVPVTELRQRLPGLPIDEVIDILKFARIGRGNIGDDNQFSFVHRRFTEYFYVQTLLTTDSLVDYEDIPNDSRTRDALVLYCEVAPEEKARQIADFCWRIIKEKKDLMNFQVLHSLRFLRDAFKGRLKFIQPFRKELSGFILEQIDKDNSILSIKLAVESVGMLEEEDMDKALAAALDMRNSWINETAFYSCRNLSKISRILAKKIKVYLNRLSDYSILIHRRELLFFLNLSEAFKKVGFSIQLRLISLYVLLGCAILLFILYPGLSISISVIAVLYCFLCRLIELFQYIILRMQKPIRMAELVFTFYKYTFCIIFLVLSIISNLDKGTFSTFLDDIFYSYNFLHFGNPITKLLITIISLFFIIIECYRIINYVRITKKNFFNFLGSIRLSPRNFGEI